MRSHNRRGRVVVIGGGITGTLTARELALDGWQVTLLESSHVGAGSSSRTAAGIRQQFSTPESVRGMRYAVQFYKEFAKEVDTGQSPIIQSGYLFLYSQPDAWSAACDRVRMQQAAGLTEVQSLATDELTKQFSWVSEETCIGGTWCPSDGFLLPNLIYQEAARTASEHDAVILQGAPVTGCERQGERIVAVHTPKGNFEADLFVDCTNAWTRRLAALLDAAPLPVDPIKRYLWFLARGGDLSAEALLNMPLVISPSGVYCRPENGEQMLMGWAHAASPDHDFSRTDQDEIEPRFSHKTGIDAIPFEAWMNLAEALPVVGEFDGITATTSGYYASTPDHNPFIGYDPATNNLIRIVGFSGHGAMFGPFSARVARELARSGEDIPSITIQGEDLSIAAFRMDREFDHAETMVI